MASKHWESEISQLLVNTSWPLSVCRDLLLQAGWDIYHDMLNLNMAGPPAPVIETILSRSRAVIGGFLWSGALRHTITVQCSL